MAQDLRGKITTSRLLSILRTASTFREAESLRVQAPGPRFHEALYGQMKAKGVNAKELIRRAGIERAYFYHLLNGRKNPGRNMVLRIGFCLGMPLQEINDLLRRAGVSELYARRRRDAALIFAVTHLYTMEQANALLNEIGEDPLYT